MTTLAKTRQRSQRTSASGGLASISSVDAIPAAMDEDTAAEYYSTHGFSAEALREMPDVTAEFPGPFIRSRPISIRVPEPMLAELKAQASRRGVAYQALIKKWLDERLQLERRSVEGVTRP